MTDIINAEVNITDVATTEDIYKLGLPEPELHKAVQKHTLSVLSEYADKGASLEVTVTPENRGQVKPLRADLNRAADRVKTELKQLKEKELAKYSIFEQSVMENLHKALVDTSAHIDLGVKVVEKEMQEGRVSFARNYWAELNNLTPVKPTYDDLEMKRSMNDTDNMIIKELTERHAAVVAEEARVAAELNTLKMLPRSERLIELYESGMTMAEAITKDQQEESYRQQIIEEQAAKIAEAAALKEAQLAAAKQAEEDKMKEEQRMIEQSIANEQKQAAQVPEIKSEAPVGLTTAPNVHTPTLSTPEELHVPQEPVAPLTVDSTTALQEITLTVIGTIEQFNDLLQYADEVGVQITGKPVVKLTKVEDMF